jgi:hypothetical protein
MGFKTFSTVSYSMMVIGSLALMDSLFCGILLKDLILEVAYGKYTSMGISVIV